MKVVTQKFCDSSYIDISVLDKKPNSKLSPPSKLSNVFHWKQSNARILRNRRILLLSHCTQFSNLYFNLLASHLFAHPEEQIDSNSIYMHTLTHYILLIEQLIISVDWKLILIIISCAENSSIAFPIYLVHFDRQTLISGATRIQFRIKDENFFFQFYGFLIEVLYASDYRYTVCYK